jgi:hypothetical protein
MDTESLAERLADLPVRGEDHRKADYIIGRLLSGSTDLGAMFVAAGDLLRRYDRRDI